MAQDSSNAGIKDRLQSSSEEALGKIFQDVLQNPAVTTALTRVFDARERASQAQEAAMGALNLPSAGDLSRLTRRVRSVAQRLEGIEDALDRLEDRLGADAGAGIEERLEAIEKAVEKLSAKPAAASKPRTTAQAKAKKPAARRQAKPAGATKRSGK